jgi:hypothetical protein
MSQGLALSVGVRLGTVTVVHSMIVRTRVAATVSYPCGDE